MVTMPTLPQGAVQLYSNKVASVPDGDYTLTVHQEISTPDKVFAPPLTSSKNFKVVGPRFSIDNDADIHSVSPLQGHADHTNTLAHVVFNRATTPWERIQSPLRKESGQVNKMPWMALLVFTGQEIAHGTRSSMLRFLSDSLL